MSTINTTTKTKYRIQELFAIMTGVPDDELGTESEPSIIALCRIRLWSYLIAQGFPFSSHDYEIPEELFNTINTLLWFYGLPIIDIEEEKELA